MACPQPDIFIRISKEFFEALCRFGMPRQDRQILDAIILKTWGFHRKEAAISNAELRETTGLPAYRICNAVASLIKRNIIEKTGSRASATYAVQKDYEKWVSFEKTQRQLRKSAIRIAEKCNISETPTDKDSCGLIAEKCNNPELHLSAIGIAEKCNSIAEKCNKAPDAPIIVKERLKKCKEIRFDCPEWLDENLFSDFIEFRKKIKKPMTENAIKLAIGRLEKFLNEGLDIREIIENSILCGYQGLFPLKNNKKGKVNIDARQDYSDDCGFTR